MTIAALNLVWLSSAYAKRKPPAPVPPVVWEGIEYRAPLDVDHMGRVQAFDLSSRRKLWETKVYHVWADPLLEEDAQWVFVSRLQVQRGMLMVKNERGKTFWLDLKTGHVEGSPRFWLLWFIAGFLLFAAAFFFWIGKGKANETVQQTS